MGARIIEREDGPRVAGTRITVYDVSYWQHLGQTRDEIAKNLGLTADQVQAALDYIEQHRQAIMAVHEHIEARNARGNPAGIRAKLKTSRAKLAAELARRQARPTETATDAGTDGGQRR